MISLVCTLVTLGAVSSHRRNMVDLEIIIKCRTFCWEFKRKNAPASVTNAHNSRSFHTVKAIHAIDAYAEYGLGLDLLSVNKTLKQLNYVKSGSPCSLIFYAKENE